jgi:hypothetical protein
MECANSVVDTFSFILDDSVDRSIEANITITDPYGNIVCSDFILGSDDWSIVGNKGIIEYPSFDPYSRGSYINHYIRGSETLINVDYYGGTDKSLWYFNAPRKFLGNLGMAYGGHLKFAFGIFAGDLSHLNYGPKYNLVELECGRCNRGGGITLLFPLTSKILTISLNENNIGLFQIPLSETYGWIKHPRNSLGIPTKPTKCEFIQVLSQLSSIRILGDITDWYETIALDNVYISNYNVKYRFPVCASSRPYAQVCTCE